MQSPNGRPVDIPVPVQVASTRARGLRTTQGRTALAMSRCLVLPSAFSTASAPWTINISRLNTLPACSPVNASPEPSRTPTHDWGSL